MILFLWVKIVFKIERDYHEKRVFICIDIHRIGQGWMKTIKSFQTDGLPFKLGKYTRENRGSEGILEKIGNFLNN